MILANTASAEAVSSAPASIGSDGAVKIESTSSTSTTDTTPVAPSLRPIKAEPGTERLVSNYRYGADFNFTTQAPFENGGNAEDRILIREADVHLRADIDSTFEGYLNFRAHDDTDTFLFELREGWIANRLDPDDQHRFKIGKFALNTDLVNTMRPWERPFISSPFALTSFFAKDQEIDTGLEYQWRALETAHTSVNLFVGVTSGYCYGDCSPLSPGERPSVPVYYLHPTLTQRWSDSRLDLGASYLGYTDADLTATQMYGVDARWTKGEIAKGLYKQNKWMGLVEWFFRSQLPSGLDASNQQGGFALLEHAWNARWTTSLRLNVFNTPSLRNDSGSLQSNLQTGFSPVISYAISPRTRGRIQYTVTQATSARQATENTQLLELQLVAQLGDEDER